MIFKPDIQKLQQYITKVVAKELMSLTEPCYYPKTKRFYFELLHLLGTTDKEFKAYIKETYKGTKAERWKLWQDPGTNILLVVMKLFLDQNKPKLFQITLTYFLIIHYSRLMFKQMSYCDPNSFRLSLEKLTRTHLFFRERSIPNALVYLSKQLARGYIDDFKNWNIERIILFVSVARHRVSQSVKSFASTYYTLKGQKIGIRTPAEPTDEENIYQYQVLTKGEKVINKVLERVSKRSKVKKATL